MHVRRALGALVAAAVIGLGSLVLPAATSSAGAAHARANQVCRNTWIRSSIVADQARHAGAALALAVTNVSSGFCLVTSRLEVQPLTATGAQASPAVGSPVVYGGMLPSYQATFSILVRTPPPCATATAWFLRVTTGPATTVVHLARSIAVCVTSQSQIVVSKVAFLHPAPCAPRAVRASLGFGQGAAGTLYTSVVFANAGAPACTVHGTPTVQSVGSAGLADAPTARKVLVPFFNRGRPVVITARGVTAVATYVVSGSGALDPATCVHVVTAGIDVTLPGYASSFLALRIAVCSKEPNQSVWGAAPPWSLL